MKRDLKARQKQANKVNLSNKFSIKKAFSSQMHLKASVDHPKEADRELREDFAIAKSKAMLEIMH